MLRRDATEEQRIGGPPPDRFRTPESYIHWDRGIAIVAGMIGIVAVFVGLVTLLPISAEDSDTSTAGLATPAAAAPAEGEATATAAAAATPTQPPANGPEPPRLAATARQFPFVRRGPGINFAAIMNLTQGQRVDVVGRNPDRLWLQIILPNSTRDRGWVSADLLDVQGDIGTLPEFRE